MVLWYVLYGVLFTSINDRAECWARSDFTNLQVNLNLHSSQNNKCTVTKERIRVQRPTISSYSALFKFLKVTSTN